MPRCPIHPGSALETAELEAGILAMRCGEGGGVWIRPSQYWRWQEGLDKQSVPHTVIEPGHDLPMSDSPAGKLCPEDGYFLIRHRVGHGLSFHIDRCGHCGGIWLDRGEWQSLQQHGLHEHLHKVFSSAWQAKVRESEHRAIRETLLKERIG